MRSPLEGLQSLGRALMLPIAVLPVAGLLLRLGQPDLLNLPFVAAAGDAIFANLGLLFAIGVAVGLARDNNGAAGLAGVVCFLIATQGAQALLRIPPDALQGLTGVSADLAGAAYKAKALAKLAVPIGIASGVVAGQFYNRFSTIRLPDYLAFFGGRRFVPIISGVAGLALAALVGLSYEALNGGVDTASRAIIGAGPLGLFVYGVLNRALIVTGLHHILNNIAWFIVGDFHGATGDLNRFFAGDPSAGQFMAGFFPVMMFGLPAACLAMYHAAPKDRRKGVAGLLTSMALTSFLTGVTEPIEFTFMFLAPLLYVVHALLTGAAFIIMQALEVKLGFGFSAGLFDYVLNFGKATRPLLLIPVGLAYFGVYYGVFRWTIARFDLKTPGRDLAATPARTAAPADRGLAFLDALGGGANLASVDACTTRLRLVIVDPSKVDEARLRALGARGLVRPSERSLQVVLGPIADQVAGEIRGLTSSPHGADPEPSTPAPASDAPADPQPWRHALGGAENIRAGLLRSSRILLDLASADCIDEDALRALGVRAVVRGPADRVQLILGPAAPQVAAGLGWS
jgi:PTS system N-acetylglucosamine-specific IIC component